MHSLVEIRPETAADHATIRALVAEVMRPNEAELIDLVRESDDYVPGLALVAAAPEGILGFVLLSRVRLDGDPDRSILALAPLCVRADHQHQGVGSALVRTALERADASEAPLVAVLGDAGYYRRFGFEPALRYGILPPTDAFPQDPFQVKALTHYRDDLRGRIVYPRSFDGTWA